MEQPKNPKQYFKPHPIKSYGESLRVERVIGGDIVRGFRIKGVHQLTAADILGCGVPAPRVGQWTTNGYPIFEWEAYINLVTGSVTGNIGDCIAFEFEFGGHLVLENTKGYGPDNDLSFITTLPISIIHEIINTMRPA